MKKTLALLLLLAGLSVEAQGKILYWTGADSGVWDYETANWLDEAGNAAVYEPMDAVVFGESGRPLVSIYAIAPASVLVDNSKNCEYCFVPDEGCDFGLAGDMSLTKKGDGELLVNLFNEYTGNTYIHGGVVIPSVTGALGSGVVYLYGGSLDLRQEQANDIVVEGQASMGGTTSGVLTLSEQSTLTLIYDLSSFVEGDAIIKDGATLDLGNNTIRAFSLGPERGAVHVGNSFIGNGKISDCKLYVAAGKTLTLLANTSATHGTNFNLSEGSSLDMGGNSVSFADTTVSSSGDGGYLGHGTIEGDLTVTSGSRINLLENTTITGGVTLGDNASLNLGKNAISASVTLSGSSATIGNGTINGDLTVAEGKSLTLLANTTVTGGVSLGAKSSLNLSGNLSGTGTISLGENAKLNLGGFTLDNNVTLTGHYWGGYIGNGTINGDVRMVQSANALTLIGDLSGEGTIYLSGGIELHLGYYTLTNNVVVESGTAGINGNNGKFNGKLTVSAGSALHLYGHVNGTGTIILGEGAELSLHTYNLGTSVTLSGKTAGIGHGNLNGSLAVESGQTLSLIGDLFGDRGCINLGTGATLDLGTHALSTSVTVNGSNAAIRNGKLTGRLTLAQDASLTLPNEGLVISKDIFMGQNANLDLGGSSFSNGISMTGTSASIGNGAITGNISVASWKTLSLSGNLSGTGTISLGDYAALNLGTHALSASVSVDGGHASIGNGSIGAGGKVTVNGGNTLTLTGDLSGDGVIAVKANATLDLDGHSLSSGLVSKLDLNVDANKAPAIIGNGTIEGNLTAPAHKNLTLLENTRITGTLTLGAHAVLDLGGNTFHLNNGAGGNQLSMPDDATIANGAILQDISYFIARSTSYTLTKGAVLNLQQHNFQCDQIMITGSASMGNGTFFGYLVVSPDSKLTLCGDLIKHETDIDITGDGTVALNTNSTVDLNGYTLYKGLSFSGNVAAATIGNGKIDNELFQVIKGCKLTLLADTSITGCIQLNEGSALDLGGNIFHVGGGNGNRIHLNGNIATIGNGTLDGDHTMEAGQSLTLCGNLKGTGTITMNDSATLNLGTHTLSKSVALNGASTVKAENTTIKALKTDKEALMQKLSVSDGLIAGTDRQASLADGLDISRMGYDLTLKNLVLTANNSISVGDSHSITLNNVTIKLSQAHYDETEGVFLFDLTSLINCDLVMENVLLDASDLTLPEGFDPANKSVVFDFGDDVTIQQATGLDMRLGNYWSPSLNLDQQGKVIFTKLVDTPEPATGTLGLLALAALAARRRKK